MNSGPLFIIGGHEDRDRASPRTILRAIASRARGGRLVLITAASAEPQGYVDEYTAAFADLGLGALVPFHATARADCSDPTRLAAFDGAAGVFFTGGDQKRLMDTILDTPVADHVRAVHERGGLVAGTSAGASAMSETMIERGPGAQSPAGGEVRFAQGLCLLPGVIIDQHFAERGRIGRLMAAIAQAPAALGLGIDENTCVIVEHGRFRVIGTGGVTVVQGGTLCPSNDAGREVLTIVDARVHLLGAQDLFDLVQARLLAGA